MTDGDDQHIPIDQSATRTMVPFLVAAGVILLVIIGIVVAAVLSPAEKNLTDSDRVAIAARNFIQSRSETVTLDAKTVCANFDENRSPLKDIAENGKKLDLVKVADTKFDGDHATAAVTYRADNHDSTATWAFTRADNTWLVCNSG